MWDGTDSAALLRHEAESCGRMAGAAGALWGKVCAVLFSYRHADWSVLTLGKLTAVIIQIYCVAKWSSFSF